MSEPQADPLLLIDGHNVIYAIEKYRRCKDEEAMPAAIECLIQDLINLSGSGDADLIVVFDGRGGGSAEQVAPRLTVMFSATSQSADSVIERLVFKSASEREITVCTADYAQQKVIWRQGVRRLFPAGLMDLMSEAAEEARVQPRGDRSLRLEDRLPDSVRASLKEMRGDDISR